MREAPSTYLSIRGLVRFLLSRWFRRVEVTGLEHLPRDRGGILVSWHPNGLVDPALIVSSFPGQVIFGARHGLFDWPGLGQLMRAAGAVPIYRASDTARMDPEQRRAQNQKSLSALAAAVAGGGFSCLFPEGDSHDAPFVMDLKTGVARFYLQARAMTPEGEAPPVIVPMGLHYDDKDSFRSHALVAFHPPLELPPELSSLPSDADEDTSKRVYEAITERVEEELREAVHATESWTLHRLMHRSRKIVQAERQRLTGPSSSSGTEMAENAVILKSIWDTYYALLETQPMTVEHLRQRVFDYDADMVSLGLEDHELDHSPSKGQLARITLLVGQLVLVFLLLPPLLVFGVTINAPAVAIVLAASRLFAKRRKDEATIKLLLGAVLLPASWATAGWLAYRGSTLLYRLDPGLPDASLYAAAVVVALGIVGGAVALRYLRLVHATLRAVRVRLTRGRRREAIDQLRTERTSIYEALRTAAGRPPLP